MRSGKADGLRASGCVCLRVRRVTPGNDHLCYNFSNNTLFGLPYCGDMKFPPPPSIAPLPTPFPFSPPPPATPPTSGTNSTLPIVASLITVCVVALLAIGGILLMLCLRRRKRRRQEEKAAAQARAEALDSGVPGASPLTGDPLLLSKSHGSQDKSTEGYQAPGLGSSGMLSGSGGANGDGSGGYFAFDEDMSPFLAALHGNARIRCMTLAELEAATDSFSPGFMIGSGGFGAVFRGTLSNGVLIAVKKRASNSQQGTKEFCNEVSMDPFVIPSPPLPSPSLTCRAPPSVKEVQAPLPSAAFVSCSAMGLHAFEREGLGPSEALTCAGMR